MMGSLDHSYYVYINQLLADDVLIDAQMHFRTYLDKLLDIPTAQSNQYDESTMAIIV